MPPFQIKSDCAFKFSGLGFSGLRRLGLWLKQEMVLYHIRSSATQENPPAAGCWRADTEALREPPSENASVSGKVRADSGKHSWKRTRSGRDTGPGTESQSVERKRLIVEAPSDSVAFIKLALHIHFPEIAGSGSVAGLLSHTFGPESSTLKRQAVLLTVLML